MSETAVWVGSANDAMSGSESAAAWAPASIGNFFNGFDVMGLAIGGPRCRVELRRAAEDSVSIAGNGPGLRAAETIPRWTVSRLLGLLGIDQPVAISIRNEIPLARGLGSSAALAVAAAKAFRALFGHGGRPASWWCRQAFEAERHFGGDHWDNVQPAFYGGLTIRHPSRPEECLVRDAPDLHLVAAVPEPSVPRLPRGRLPLSAPTQEVVRCLAAVAWSQALGPDGRADRLVECVGAGPLESVRADAVPFYAEAARIAREEGAAAFVSGGGPSLCAAAPTHAAARAVLRGWRELAPLREGLVFITRGLPPFAEATLAR